MKSLWVLIKMQMKEKLNFKRFEVEGMTLFKLVLSTLVAIIKFALVTALCVAFIILAKLTGLLGPGINRPIYPELMTLLFSFMLILSVASAVLGITKSMYFSRDNAVLLTLPCPSIQVYLSKLIIFFAYEMKRNFSFLVPLLTAYYITHMRLYSPWIYPWMVFCVLCLSFFTVVLASLLSIPAMWVTSFFRQHRSLQIGSGVVLVLAAAAMLFVAISMIPESVDIAKMVREGLNFKIRDFLKQFVKAVPPLYQLAILFLGVSENFIVTFPFVGILLRLLVLLGISFALLGIGLLIVRPLFYKMASKPFEYLKKNIDPKKNRVHAWRISLVNTNYLVTFKSTDRMFTNVGILFSVPMMIYLLNKIFLAMDTRDLGNHMIVAFNLLIILLVVLNSNSIVASIFSREGRSSYLLKTHPSKYPILIFTKLLPSASFVLVSIISTAVILFLTLPIKAWEIVLLSVAILFGYLAHMFYCTVLDIMNPQNELYASVGHPDSNPNETKATVTAFIFSFVAAAGLFLLLLEGSKGVFLKLVLVALALLVYRISALLAVLRLYYKEK